MGKWQGRLDVALSLAKIHQTKIRFLLVGGLNTVVGLGMYPALYIALAPLKIGYLTVLGVSQTLCVAFSYFTSKFIVFKTTGNYLPETLRFLIFHSALFLVNLAVLPALVQLGGLDPISAQTMFAVVVIVSSYFWHSRITFSGNKSDVNE